MDAKEKEANGSIETSTEQKAESPSNMRKYVWICVLLAVAGGFIGHISIQLQNYLRFRMLDSDDPVKTKMELPEIIFCAPTYFAGERTEKYKWNNGTVDYREKIFNENLRNAYFALVEGTLNVSHLPDDRFDLNLEFAKLAFLPTLAVSDVGSTIPDIITFCEFGRFHTCDIRNFTAFFNHKYGLCIRFQEHPHTTQKIGIGARNGLIVKVRFGDNLKVFDLEREYFYSRTGYKFFIQPKETWPNLEKVQHASTPFYRSFMSVSHVHYIRMDTMTAPCRPDAKQRLCFLERSIGLTCKDFLIDDYALMQLYAQNSLVEKCKCISYEWTITEAQKNYPSCHSLPPEVYLNAGLTEVNDTIMVTMTNGTRFRLNQLLDVAATRERIQCFQDAKKNFQKTRIEQNYETNKEKMWTPLCNQDLYDTTISTLDNPMKEGTLAGFSKDVFLIGWEAQMKALNESGINQTCVFEDNVRSLLEDLKFDCGSNVTCKLLTNSRAAKAEINLKNFERYTHQFLLYPSSLLSIVRRQVYEYPSAQFFADVGGLSGVWIGLCVLSVFDLIESSIKSMKEYFRNK